MNKLCCISYLKVNKFQTYTRFLQLPLSLMFYLNFHCNQMQIFNSPESKDQVLSLNILIFAGTTEINWTKPRYYTPWKILFQNCVW